VEYIFADLIIFIAWIGFYYLRKDLRKEILIMSILAAPLGLFDLLFVPGYWKPITLFELPIGIEGIIFSFLIGGLAAVSYIEVSKKKLTKIKKFHRHFSVFVFVISLPILIGCYFLHILNIEIALYLALVIGAAVIVFVRKDLFKSAFLGGLVFGLIYSFLLIVWMNLFPSSREWFLLSGLPRIFLFNAPIYEMVFAFLFGAYWGNIYELLYGYKL